MFPARAGRRRHRPSSRCSVFRKQQLGPASPLGGACIRSLQVKRFLRPSLAPSALQAGGYRPCARCRFALCSMQPPPLVLFRSNPRYGGCNMFLPPPPGRDFLSPLFGPATSCKLSSFSFGSDRDFSPCRYSHSSASVPGRFRESFS